MRKKLLVSVIVSLIICSAVLIGCVSSDTIAQPTQLKITVSPPSLPADNSQYNCIFVQLQDSNGNPARAGQDVTISLSSSQTEIGTVDPAIYIPRGSTYGSADFNTTYTSGQTTITATATGYPTVQAAVTTVGPKPYTLAVYGFPPTLPADGGSYGAIMVQLQDYMGSPAKAPIGGTQVSLSCSNLTVGDVSHSVIIPEGQTYAVATFNTTDVEGHAVVTSIASDYFSANTTISTQVPITPSDKMLSIFTGPQKVLADNMGYKQIAVQIVDDSGHIAAVSSDVTVTIASSDKSIGTTEATITIPQSKTYALATLTTTYKAGATVITAAADDFSAASQAITTTGYTASKLAVFCVPSTLPSDNAHYQAVQVQLQDAQGYPAKASGADLTVNLFSSQPTVASVDTTLVIPLGKTCAAGSLTVTNSAGETSVTAQASGYMTAQATLTTYAIDHSPLHVAVTADLQSVLNGKPTGITAYVTADGSPVTGAIVNFASDNGGTFTQTKEGNPGYYTTNYTASNFDQATTCIITANASKSGFLDSQGSVQITVSPTLATTSSSSLGMLVLRVVDGSGNYLSDATVYSTVQPAGAGILSASTNGTGYVAFNNVKAGVYTFQVTKSGYQTLQQPVNFNGTPLSMALTLTGGSNAQGDNSLLLIIAVVVVAVVVAVVGVVLVKRRKPAKALEPLNWPLKS